MSGLTKIPGIFKALIKKSTVIGEELSKTKPCVCVCQTLDYSFDSIPLDIYAYDGEGDTDWAEDESGNLLPQIRLVCTLKADLSGLQRLLRVEKGPNGQNFWRVKYNVNVYFGGTALRARLTWYEGVSNLHFHPQGAEMSLSL